MPEPKTGKVTFVNKNQGWGFITTSFGLQVYFHLNEGPEGNNQMPNLGDRVVLHIKKGEKGPKATSWTWEGRELESNASPVWSGRAPFASEFCQRNLKKFKIVDVVVTGQLQVARRGRNGKVKNFMVKIGPMKLSELCGDVVNTIDGLRQDDKVSAQIHVFVGDQEIGLIQSRMFLYYRASTLQESLAWAIVTSFGHEAIIFCNIDKMAEYLSGSMSLWEFVDRFKRTFVFDGPDSKLFLGSRMRGEDFWDVAQKKCLAA